MKSFKSPIKVLMLTATLLSVPAVARANWTSVYAGIGIGADALPTDLSFNSAANANVIGIDNIGGGDFGASVRAGADWQLSDWLVIGALAEYARSTVETTASVTAESPDTIASAEARLLDLHQSWAIAGRVGVIISPTTLAYALLGYTRAELSDPRLSTSEQNVFVNSASLKLSSFDGITFGGGFEHRLSNNVSLWAEYRQTRLDAQSPALNGGSSTLTIDPTLHMGRIGVSYRFGGDQSASPEPQAAGASRWNGLYAGIGAGVDGIEGAAAVATSIGDFAVDARGSGVGGGDLGGTIVGGYDIQPAPRVVMGLLVSYDASLADVSLNASSDGESVHLDVPSLGGLWTFAARAGYQLTDDLIAYGLIGYARLDFTDWRVAAGNFSAEVNSPHYNGIAYGVGFEKLMGENLSLRAEYRYADMSERTFGSIDVNSGLAVQPVSLSVDPNVHVVRLMGIYRFGTP